MDENGFIISEEACSLLKPPTRFEQHCCLVAKLDGDAKAAVGFDKVDDLLGKMVYIDNDFCHADSFQLFNEDLYEWLTIDGYHRLGHRIG